MKILLDFYLKLSSRFPIARWTPIPLRLIVGYGFMEHGFAKLSRGVDSFAAILQAMGVPEPHLMARTTILIELFGGFAVILGAFVAIVSMPMTALLLVAIFKVHLPYGFSSIKLLAVTASGAKFGPGGLRGQSAVYRLPRRARYGRLWTIRRGQTHRRRHFQLPAAFEAGCASSRSGLADKRKPN